MEAIMNLTHLRYMVEIERYGSITKAASAMYMGQPNLSKALKEMECELGVPLFRRSAKGVIPTEKGKEFLMHAKSILAQIEKIEQIGAEDDHSSLEFSLLLPRASYISHAFTLFLNEVDAVEKMSIKFKETNSMNAIEAVADCEYSLGIIRYPLNYEAFFLDALEEKGLKAREIWTYDYVLLMSAQSPLSRALDIRSSVLNDYIEILHGDNIVPNISQSVSKKDAQLGSSRRHIFVYERGSQFDILSTVPNSYMWVSPLPRDVLRRYGLVQKPCSDLVKRNRDLLIHQSSYRLSATDKLFIETLDEVRKSIIV